jgi:hypothetical protein
MRIHIVGGLLLFASIGFSTPVGTLRIANCDGDGVTVTATTIDWLPAGGGTGCIVTGTPTAINYQSSGGPASLGAGVAGTIKDLPTSPLTDFMLFNGNPDLHFELLGLGPGPSRTDCAALLLFESCAAFPNSPFTLTLSADGQTTVSLRAFGIVTDAGAVKSTWNGSFSATFPDMDPAAIQAVITSPGGSITSTDSGSFTLTAIPEPMSLVLIGSGLLLAGLTRQRYSRS